MSRRIITNSDGSQDLLSEEETSRRARKEYLNSRMQIRVGVNICLYLFSSLFFIDFIDFIGGLAAETKFDEIMLAYFKFIPFILAKWFVLVMSVQAPDAVQVTAYFAIPSAIILWALSREEPNIFHKIIYSAIPFFVFIPYCSWVILRCFL